jgi:hypothetical protein
MADKSARAIERALKWAALLTLIGGYATGYASRDREVLPLLVEQLPETASMDKRRGGAAPCPWPSWSMEKPGSSRFWSWIITRPCPSSTAWKKKISFDSSSRGMWPIPCGRGKTWTR